MLDCIVAMHSTNPGTVMPTSTSSSKVSLSRKSLVFLGQSLSQGCIFDKLVSDDTISLICNVCLVQLIEHPILQIPNFNFPNLRCCKVFFSFRYNELCWHFWVYFDINFIWKKYSKSKQTKYSGFVKLGLQ